MVIIMDAMTVIPSDTAALRSHIESCLNQDLFSMVIHPTVDFRTGRVLTGEALSRLHYPEHNAITADVFIPLLESMGLHSKFDRYVFRKCCIWMRQAAAEGRQFDRIDCNFSRKTLSQPDIVGDLIQIADSCEIPHSKLGIEITEWTCATDAQQIIKNLRQLKEAGFRIILDDYGSGVTSETDLQNFPLDIVKIDCSLLRNTATEKGDEAFRTLVRRFISMGAEVVCEGIETEAHDSFARETGCHYGQGFLYFKPISHDKVFDLIQHRENP